MSDLYLTKLQVKRIHQMIYHPNALPKVLSEEIEKDGRKRPRVIKDLIDGGYLEPDDGNQCHLMTDKVFESIEPEAVDLVVEFDKRLQDDKPVTKYPYIYFEELTVGQQKTLLTNHVEYRWLWLKTDISYNSGLFEKLWDNESKYLEGDGTVQYAVKSHWHSRLVITDAAVRQRADELNFTRKVEEAYPQNLQWGLAKLGLIDARDMDSFNKAFYRPVGGSFFSGLTQDKIGPDQWDDRIEISKQRIHNKIAELHDSLLLLDKVDNQVKIAGGWDVVKKNYREALEEVIRNG